MAVTTGTTRASRFGLPPAVADWLTTTRAALDRPLASYYLLLGSTALLLVIGLMMVLSASSVASYREQGTSYYWFLKQLSWAALAVPAAFLASRLPTRVLRTLGWVGLLASFALIALTKTGLGVEVSGNRNWLRLGPMTLQPSEVAKLACVMWAADVFARKERLLGQARHTLIPFVPVMLALIALIVGMQRDLGTALILVAILLGLLWVAGAPGRLFALAVGISSALALFLVSYSDERRERLMTFVDPFKDFENAGWQAAHGLFALSSGGVFGKGLSASQQKWGALPEAHTDFIFAVLGEELGLVGTLLVLALFATMALAAVRIAVHTEDPFVRYLSAGVMIWLMSQTMINIGMVLTLLPVVGVPLPLVSYGGSSLLPTLVALGLLLGFARREPAARAALAERRRDRVRGVHAGVGTRRRPGVERGRPL